MQTSTPGCRAVPALARIPQHGIGCKSKFIVGNKLLQTACKVSPNDRRLDNVSQRCAPSWSPFPRQATAQGIAEEDGTGQFLSDDEVDELIADAAGFICVLDELRPLDPAAYNPFYDVWTRIAKIPPAERHRLLGELEPGSLRNLWKASMARYVLDERRSLELFSDTSVWDDYPGEPGQVFVYEGRCERYELDGAGATLQVDRERQEALQGPPSAASAFAPWLRPLPTSFETPVTRFTQLFFVPPGDWSARPAAAGWGGGDGRAEPGEPLPPPPVYSRVVLPFVGPLDRWWEAIYCRLQVELTLTPVSRDAGADLLLLYPEDPEAGGEGEGGPRGWALQAPGCLPPGRLWPAPDPAAHSRSPLSGGPRDYMRVAGPGVYVGCAYRQGPRPGEYREEDCVYFAIARKA